MLDFVTDLPYKQRSRMVCSAPVRPLTTTVGEYDMATLFFRSNYAEVKTQHYGPFWSCVCIPLTCGEHCLIDADDFERIGNQLWHLKRANSKSLTRYALALKKEKMHRLLVDAPKEMCVDHINGNSLDNRKANLRICTRQQNRLNRGPNQGKSYKGVMISSVGNIQVRIRVDGKTICIGTYYDPISAAKAYDEAAIKYHGEFARLNFPRNKQSDDKQLGSGEK